MKPESLTMQYYDIHDIRKFAKDDDLADDEIYDFLKNITTIKELHNGSVYVAVDKWKLDHLGWYDPVEVKTMKWLQSHFGNDVTLYVWW